MRLSIGLLGSLLAVSGFAYEVKTPPLTTDWTYKVGTNPWPEYPRPQLQRSQWRNLNGVWRYRRAQSRDDVTFPPPADSLTEEVLVPSCLESGLSGIQGRNTHFSWYSTSFKVPRSWRGQHVLLNFAAVDYEATVFVNGKQAGFHRGGYFAFTLDVTEHVSFDGDNALLVFVYDPTDAFGEVIPIGKQTLNPSHIFYTPCSGIWQSVWIEAGPSNYITQLDVNADMDGQVTVLVHSSSGESTPVEVIVHKLNSDAPLVSHEGTSDKSFQFKVPSPKLWSPDSPTLYNITVVMGDDEVSSYTGFRTVSRGRINGVERPLLNGKFLFQFGTLDQGYWPDGLHTPPSREAMEYDLKVLKRIGFNMLRKHIKIETPLFYRACDELGLLLIQDMPSMNIHNGARPNAAQQAEFGRQLELMINQFKSYPSIVTWVIYNEGWGQLGGAPEYGLTERVRKIDPTRLVDAVSGWNDNGAGDFHDNHHYAAPQCGAPFYSRINTPYDSKRIGIQGEFGGIGHNVSIEHLWNVQAAIDTIDETYELADSIDVWNYRAHVLLSEILDHTKRFACSGGVWTQTTDVEGEVNGLMTYDRRILRVDEKQWKTDIQALYDAAKARAE
ncbi:hypothetical protein VTO42DRAFT_3544 [Malbranchea cinnamomea]